MQGNLIEAPGVPPSHDGEHPDFKSNIEPSMLCFNFFHLTFPQLDITAHVSTLNRGRHSVHSALVYQDH